MHQQQVGTPRPFIWQQGCSHNELEVALVVLIRTCANKSQHQCHTCTNAVLESIGHEGWMMWNDD